MTTPPLLGYPLLLDLNSPPTHGETHGLCPMASTVRSTAGALLLVRRPPVDLSETGDGIGSWEHAYFPQGIGVFGGAGGATSAE